MTHWHLNTLQRLKGEEWSIENLSLTHRRRFYSNSTLGHNIKNELNGKGETKWSKNPYSNSFLR